MTTTKTHFVLIISLIISLVISSFILLIWVISKYVRRRFYQAVPGEEQAVVEEIEMGIRVDAVNGFINPNAVPDANAQVQNDLDSGQQPIIK